MRLVHLTASTFLGGPERQMLGLAAALPGRHSTRFLSFAEAGRCEALLGAAREAGFAGESLTNDTPRLRSAIAEIADRLRGSRTDVLVCHSYKANLLGRPAARRAGVPVISVSRGWTGESLKVRLYEALDRLHLRYFDRVVCVSEGQARKVRKARVPAARLRVIRNACRLRAFQSRDPAYRARLRALFPNIVDGDRVICAAGRLSPEKGFQVLVEAAAQVVRADPTSRFIHFGDGVLRGQLAARIRELRLESHFVLAGFHSDLDRFLPWVDMVVLPSFTEGLPNIALEASAAGKPVVATAVGGNPEVVRDNETGFLVPAGDAPALARRLLDLSRHAGLREELGRAARQHMYAEFTFEAQAEAYQQLLEEVASEKKAGSGNRGRQLACT